MWMESIVSAEFSENNRQPDDRLIVKSAGRVIFILTSEIDWIEADANYVRLHVSGNSSHLVRLPISKMAAQLDNSQFIRIRRSFIVNVARIRALQPCNSGEFIVSLRDGKELPCSRTYRRFVQALYSPR